MSKAIIQTELLKESRSYIDCLYAVLKYKGMFSLPKFMLSGMSGIAFKFVVHKRLLPSSLDMYNWVTENWKAVDTLGIYTETYEGSQLNPTFPLYRKEAIKKIKDSGDVALISTIKLTNDEEWIEFNPSQGKKAKMLVFCGPTLIFNGDVPK